MTEDMDDIVDREPLDTTDMDGEPLNETDDRLGDELEISVEQEGANR